MKRGKSDKAGQEMSLSTIIIIVLGVIVLVFLIYGFSIGWGNFFDKIRNIGGTRENIGTIRNSCQVACDAQKKYDYCEMSRTIRTSEKYCVPTKPAETSRSSNNKCANDMKETRTIEGTCQSFSTEARYTNPLVTPDTNQKLNLNIPSCGNLCS